jgi:hypothetical protein
VDRREFLGASITAAAVTVAAPARAMAAQGAEAVVIFDTRFEEATRFAAVMSRHGLRTFGFAGDATALWHNELVKALGRGKAVIGLTAGGARFCLQLMASPGIRCIHHVTHAASSLGQQHACWTGEKGTDQELRCAQSWPEKAAVVAIRQAIHAPLRPVNLTISRKFPAHQLPAAEHLESWVLAPARAAMRDDHPLFPEWNS